MGNDRRFYWKLIKVSRGNHGLGPASSLNKSRVHYQAHHLRGNDMIRTTKVMSAWNERRLKAAAEFRYERDRRKFNAFLLDLVHVQEHPSSRYKGWDGKPEMGRRNCLGLKRFRPCCCTSAFPLPPFRRSRSCAASTTSSASMALGFPVRLRRSWVADANASCGM